MYINNASDKENTKLKKMYFALGIFEIFSFVTLLNVSVFNSLFFNFTTEMVSNIFYIINVMLTLAMAISYFKMKPKWCGIVFSAKVLRSVVSLVFNAFEGELDLFSVSTVIYIAECLLISYMFLAYDVPKIKPLCFLTMLLTVSGTLIDSASRILEAFEKDVILIIIVSIITEFGSLAFTVAIMCLLLKTIQFERTKNITQTENQIEN